LEGQELAARHIALRERAGLTQEQEAKMAGVSPTTISGIESGKITRPHLRTLLKIARALGADVGELRASGKVEAPPSSTQPPLNGFEEERREDRKAALRDAIQDLRLTAERFERYHTAQKTLDGFREGWEKRLAEEDFDKAAIKEAGRTINGFWPAVTALADSEMIELMQYGYQIEEAAAESALVPAIERFQALCERVNTIYSERFRDAPAPDVIWLTQRKAS
jgi:transcriptional regulator with XRE-family HTH domain